MTSLLRTFAVLFLVASTPLLGPVRLAAQDKKDPDPFKLKKADPKADNKDADPFKLKKADPKADNKDADPFKLKKADPKADNKDPLKEKKADPLPDNKDPDPFKLKKKPILGTVEKEDKGKPEEYPYFQSAVEAKIRRVSGPNQDEFTIEVKMIDPMKVAKFQEWQTKQLIEINSAKTAKEQVEKAVEYQKELPKRQVDIFTNKEFEVRAAEKIKVRTMDPPLEYDDKGFIKQWTAKELAAIKGNTEAAGLPGLGGGGEGQPDGAGLSGAGDQIAREKETHRG